MCMLSALIEGMPQVEGMNSNAKLAIRKARGFRTYEALVIALYHQLGCLPEPIFTHRFC
jgi:transposase